MIGIRSLWLSAMSNVLIKLNSGNIRAFLRSADMQSMLESRAAEITFRAGPGYEYRSHDSGQRIITNVYAETEEAIQDNLENNTLLKALR